MTKLFLPLLVALIALPVAAGSSTTSGDKTRSSKTASAAPTDEQLEKSLQSLSWPQFKSVVTAVPVLKSNVDAYGQLGWRYVETNYKTYSWRKSVSKLDVTQKKELAVLIEKARKGAPLPR